LVQVTRVPTGTGSVAGANAKLLMPTALGPVAGSSVGEPVPLGATDALAVPPPGIPGVTLACEPKLIDGWVLGAGCRAGARAAGNQQGSRRGPGDGGQRSDRAMIRSDHDGANLRGR